MQFYVKIPPVGNGLTPLKSRLRRSIRAHATELVYSEVNYFLGLAQEQWPEIDWRIEAARTAR